MARPPDPYRTLELTRGATLDEVKASYRRLAKLYHPDSAGEKALPRFLAIQAAYESLTEGPARLRLGTASRSHATPPARPRRPGEPDPDRGRTSRSSAAGSRSASGGARTSTGGTRSTGAGSSSRTGESRGATGSSTGSTTGPRPRRDRRKPTSTSYDGADLEPFEPEWEGASWYGGSSGTYWQLNPKEFADPRKHGPEYQARGRREAARTAASAAAPGSAPAGAGAGSGATQGPGAGDDSGHPAGPSAHDVPPNPSTHAASVGEPPAATAATGGATALAEERARPTAAAISDDAPPIRDPVHEPVPGGAGLRASAARFVRGLTGTARRGT